MKCERCDYDGILRETHGGYLFVLCDEHAQKLHNYLIDNHYSLLNDYSEGGLGLRIMEKRSENNTATLSEVYDYRDDLCEIEAVLREIVENWVRLNE